MPSKLNDDLNDLHAKQEMVHYKQTQLHSELQSIKKGIQKITLKLAILNDKIGTLDTSINMNMTKKSFDDKGALYNDDSPLFTSTDSMHF